MTDHRDEGRLRGVIRQHFERAREFFDRDEVRQHYERAGEYLERGVSSIYRWVANEVRENEARNEARKEEAVRRRAEQKRQAAESTERAAEWGGVVCGEPG